MSSERLVNIFDLMARRERAGDGPGSLCEVAALTMEVEGAAIVLTAPTGPLTCFCSSSEVAHSLVDLEITLGEGPFSVATTSDESVELTNTSSAHESNWPSYVGAAAELVARAVYAFPLRIGAIRLGALGLYHSRAGPLSEDQSINGYLMASVVARAVLALEAGAPSGLLAPVLHDELSVDVTLHQASGMVAVQGSMSVADAQVALRARAFSTGEKLFDVVRSVINRDVRWEPRTRTWLRGDERAS